MHFSNLLEIMFLCVVGKLDDSMIYELTSHINDTMGRPTTRMIEILYDDDVPTRHENLLVVIFFSFYLFKKYHYYLFYIKEKEKTKKQKRNKKIRPDQTTIIVENFLLISLQIWKDVKAKNKVTFNYMIENFHEWPLRLIFTYFDYKFWAVEAT